MSEVIDLLADLLGPDSAPLKPLAPSARPVTPADPEAACMGRVSEANLAQLLGLTAGRIRQLQQDGVIQRMGRGDESFDIAGSVRAYCDFLRSSVKRQGVTDHAKAAKLRKELAQADKAEMQAAALRRDLVPAEEVRQIWLSVMADTRAGVLASVAKIKLALPSLSKADLTTIDREIRSALERLYASNA